MLPIYPGGHVAYQNFVVEQLRNHYANPAELPDALLDIAERFWEKDLTGVDTLMQAIAVVHEPSAAAKPGSSVANP